jgi:hypothetical protein
MVDLLMTDGGFTVDAHFRVGIHNRLMYFYRYLSKLNFVLRSETLKPGTNVHHKINKVPNVAKDCIKATNDKENLKIASSHFEKINNRESSYDPYVVEEIPQQPESVDFDQDLKKTIKGMASMAAAPGESGLSPMAMKNSPQKCV